MPSHLAVNLARAYYALAGLIAAGAGVAVIAGAIVTALSGCVLVFSQSDFFVGPPTTGPIPENLPQCQQYVDLVSIGIQLALGAILLLTAWRFSRHDPTSTMLLRAGAVVGIVVGAVPGWFIWWLMDYYHQTPGVPEFAIGLLPFVAGLLAAWVTWRADGNWHLETTVSG